MPHFKLTYKAIQDLTEIWEYTLEAWSERQAENYYQMIIGCCTELAKEPLSGKDYSEIYTGLFGKKISKHIVFYRIVDSFTIEILRVLHEQMDLEHKWRD